MTPESESEVTQSCPTLCDLMDCSLPGSSVHGIFPGKNTEVGCRFLLQGNLPNPGIEPISPASPALAGRFFATKLPEKPFQTHYYYTDTDDIDKRDICMYMDRYR